MNSDLYSLGFQNNCTSLINVVILYKRTTEVASFLGVEGGGTKHPYEVSNF